MSEPIYKMPYKISEYVKERFREDFLFEVKRTIQDKGHIKYIVEVTKDDYIHTLTFDEAGEIITQDVVETFPPDIHEERGIDSNLQ